MRSDRTLEQICRNTYTRNLYHVDVVSGLYVYSFYGLGGLEGLGYDMYLADKLYTRNTRI